MMHAFRLASPWAAVLFLLPLLVFVLQRRRTRPAVLYSGLTLLHGLPVTLRTRLRRMLPVLQTAGFVCIIAAIMRPQSGQEEFRVRTEGIAIQMCLDRSGSMQAMDFPLNDQQVDRLTAVKHVFQQFVAGGEGLNGRPDDLIGLIAFGGYATALCPPTLDHGALADVLETVEIPQPIRDRDGRVINETLLREEQATAIGDAVALAVDRLRHVDAKSRIIVLLSDGENTAGVVSPDDAARAAAEFGFRIYTIGVGSTGMAPFPAVDMFGRRVLQAQPVRLDEDSLRRMAETTGGQYFNAKDTAALRDVCRQIDELEKTEVEGTVYTRYRELFPYPLFAGLACVIAALVLDSTLLRSAP
ncbi:MAG: VWA domain-containing protein [Planctomycetaceae bacterium]|nr:VWA domain-containing protein [Planctomycetaceae bacterium]